MMLFSFVALVPIIIILIYTFLKRKYSRSPDDPPGPDPQIFFGNLVNSGMFTGRLTFHEVLAHYQRQYGDTFVFWYGPHPCLVFCLPEHAQTIFADRHTFEQSPLFLPNFDLLCPHAIILLRDAKWKRHIRVMLPMFKRAKIIHYLGAITGCVDRFIDQHLRHNETHKDLRRHCQSLAMNIIGWVAFNYDLENAMDTSVKEAMENFAFQSTLLMINTWMPRWLIRMYLKLNWKYQDARQQIQQLIEKIIENEQNNRDTTENQRPKNLIASMVASLNENANDEQVSSGLTRAEIFDEILLSIIAGYEITSTALTWFIFYMSKNPHIQQRLKEELREQHLLMTTGDETPPSLTQEKLDSLVYCECVVKEVLRLGPTNPMTTRMALNDTVIDNVRIRRGQTIFIATYNMNTDARYWHESDPTQFVPERFLGADKNHHPCAMLSFGGGHRACPGQDLAWFELKTIIVRLMQRGVVFEDTPENTGGYKEDVTCAPKNLVVHVRIDQQ